MAQFEAFNKNAEVNGKAVLSIAYGLGAMQSVGFSILAEHGIINPKPDIWYPQQKWLNAFKHIAEKVGAGSLYKIGLAIPDNAEFPLDIENLHDAFIAIDVAFHLNHRIDDKVLYDPETRKMSEGIGHYHYKKINDKKAEITCDNPYPCDFDKGIIAAMARKFGPIGSKIKIDHDEKKSCRKNGDEKCVYIVSW
ncbi:MAG: hypothetical protein MUC95_04045 [Spirochaetes bacterium]|nr:hypothetical protein [Spirochaetota bacterium]